MIKILPFAVVILAALWLFRDTYAEENKHWPNLEEFDFYFDDKLSNESTQHGYSKSKTAEFNRNKDHKSIAKPNSGHIPEDPSVWNLNRLFHYFVSFLYSVNENNSQEGNMLDEYQHERGAYSQNSKIGSNRTNTTHITHKDSNSENVSDIELENSGEGKDDEFMDDEYYEYDVSFENFSEKVSVEYILNSTDLKPEISEDQQSDNLTLPSEVSQFDRESAKHSFLRTGHVSDEFIDEYINPPSEEVLTESDENSTTNWSSEISSESEEQTSDTLKDDASEDKTEDRELINPRNPVLGNTTRDMDINLNQELKNDEFPRNESEHLNSTSYNAFSNQTGDLKKGNLKETSTDKNPLQNSFQSNNSTLFIGDMPPDNKTYDLKTTPVITEHTSKNFNGNSNSPEEIKVSRPENKEDYTYEKNPKTFSVVDDSQKDQSLKENKSQISEPELQSGKMPYNTEKMFLQHQLNSSKSPVLQDEYNSPNRLPPQNDSTDTESRSDTDMPTEHEKNLTNIQIKYPKLNEKQNWEFFNASEKSKIQTGSRTDSSSSESSSSEELYEDGEYDDTYYDTQMPNFVNYFTDTFSNATTEFAQNVSAPYTNYSTEIELPTSSKNESKITLPKTQETFNTILEFLYKYSNSTWIKKMKEENRRV